MREFLRRLKKVGEFLAALIISLALISGATCIFVFFPAIQTVLKVIVYGSGTIISALAITVFIYWLFVEPFRKGRAK